MGMDKIDDFGLHAKHYYQLDHEYWKSSAETAVLESLCVSEYWKQTLAEDVVQHNAKANENLKNEIVTRTQNLDPASMGGKVRAKREGHGVGMPAPSKDPPEDALDKIVTAVGNGQLETLANRVFQRSLFANMGKYTRAHLDKRQGTAVPMETS